MSQKGRIGYSRPADKYYFGFFLIKQERRIKEVIEKEQKRKKK